MNMTRNEIIYELLRLFGQNGENWTKRATAKDEDGYSCDTHSHRAKAFCMAGGLGKVCDVNVFFAETYLANAALRELISDMNKNATRHAKMDFMHFNDSPDTRFNDIKEFLESLLVPERPYMSAHEIIDSAMESLSEEPEECLV